MQSHDDEGPWGSHEFLDELRLEYGRAIAEKLDLSPHAVLRHAVANLDRWLVAAEFDPEEIALRREWRELLEVADIARIREILVDPSEEGKRLRQSSPFSGLLSSADRDAITEKCEERSGHRDGAARR